MSDQRWRNPELVQLIGPLMRDGGQVLVLLGRAMYSDLSGEEWMQLRERLVKHAGGALDAARTIERWCDPTKGG